MRYPESLKKGDSIGVTAISAGIDDDKDLLRFENAIKNLENLGYKVIHTKNCLTNFKGRSSTRKTTSKRIYGTLYKS